MSELVYDAQGFRFAGGIRYHRDGDKQVLSNLRFKWPEDAAHLDDAKLISLWDAFSSSDDFEQGDGHFKEWLDKSKPKDA